MAGLIFLRLNNLQTGLNDRISAAFFIIVFSLFAGVNGPTFLFPTERGVFFRYTWALQLDRVLLFHHLTSPPQGEGSWHVLPLGLLLVQDHHTAPCERDYSISYRHHLILDDWCASRIHLKTTLIPPGFQALDAAIPYGVYFLAILLTTSVAFALGLMLSTLILDPAQVPRLYSCGLFPLNST